MWRFSSKIKVKKGELYGFVRHGFEFYKDISEKMIVNFAFNMQFYKIYAVSYIVNSSEKELFILYMPDDNYIITYLQLLKQISCHYEIIIGKNNIIDNSKLPLYYYILGISNCLYDI